MMAAKATAPSLVELAHSNRSCLHIGRTATSIAVSLSLRVTKFGPILRGSLARAARSKTGHAKPLTNGVSAVARKFGTSRQTIMRARTTVRLCSVVGLLWVDHL